VKHGEIDMVIFFRDPEIVQDYEAEVVAFVKECIRQNIPLASNRASAELLILGMIRMEVSRKK
jgi:methylglyoxal synthase